MLTLYLKSSTHIWDVLATVLIFNDSEANLYIVSADEKIDITEKAKIPQKGDRVHSHEIENKF